MDDHTPYDFSTMPLDALKAALDAPTGAYFARSIANELYERTLLAAETITTLLEEGI